MTQLTHCDGPGCEEVQPDADRHARGLCNEGWLTVEREFVDDLTHFCSRACLARWAAPTTEGAWFTKGPAR